MRTIVLKGILTGNTRNNTGMALYNYSLHQKEEFLCKALSVEKTSRGWNVEYSVDRPKRPIMFCGMMVDLEDGMCYASAFEDAEGIVLARINEIFAEYFNVFRDVEAAILLVETLRLSANLDRAVERVGNTVQSMIGASLVKIEKIGDAKAALKWFLKVLEDIYKVADIVTKASDLEVDQKAEVNRTLGAAGVSVIYAKMSEFNYATSWGVTLSPGERMLILSCKHTNTGPERHNDYEMKSKWLAISALELADSLEEGNDTVLTADLKKKYNQLGFNKVISDREVSSLVRAKDVIKMQRSSVELVADTSEVSDSGTDNSSYYKVLRNSLKQVSKVVTKILKVKEGK